MILYMMVYVYYVYHHHHIHRALGVALYYIIIPKSEQ